MDDKTFTRAAVVHIVSLAMHLSRLLVLVFLELWHTIYADNFEFDAQRDIIFELRVRNRPFENSEMFTDSSFDDLKMSTFDPKRPTTFLVHGYLEDRKIKSHLLLSK
jgi:hypothetical protein